MSYDVSRPFSSTVSTSVRRRLSNRRTDRGMWPSRHRISSWITRWTLGVNRVGLSRPYWTRHWAVGASCLMYLMPTSAYLYQAYTNNAVHLLLIGLWYGFVTFVSFMADYVCLPEMSPSERKAYLAMPPRKRPKFTPSAWGTRDRVVASIAFWVSAAESSTGADRK
ncbi:hypothetical protein FOZ62_031127 [Perkinsus olseni]|uniref:Uncharacterized protein n=1 Tax=Perkinsus olseni TaxID=32597 RepID=A0A7J6RFE1_PEROL|nr:hypothetical protein FOZ62_031127 [Perkinsus olseni]